MKVLIFGGTGFIGKRLQEKLKEKGHEVELSDVRKDPTYSTKISQSEAVINLGGHPLFKDRWNDRVKALIQDSRTESTSQIVDAIGKAEEAGNPPKVLVNASAIGFYGNGSFDEVFDEDSGLGPDFLARVCGAWEEEAQKAERVHGVRTAIVRIGVVLGKGGGALQQLLPVFKFGQGSLIGSGEQPFSWVHIDDVVGLLVHALENNVHGPLNAASPGVVNNAEFSRALGKALSRPQVGLLGPEFFQKAFGSFVKVMLHVLVGGAAEVIADGQNVNPKKSLESGYRFQYEKVDEALKEIVA